MKILIIVIIITVIQLSECTSKHGDKSENSKGVDAEFVEIQTESNERSNNKLKKLKLNSKLLKIDNNKEVDKEIKTQNKRADILKHKLIGDLRNLKFNKQSHQEGIGKDQQIRKKSNHQETLKKSGDKYKRRDDSLINANGIEYDDDLIDNDFNPEIQESHKRQKRLENTKNEDRESNRKISPDVDDMKYKMEDLIDYDQIEKMNSKRRREMDIIDYVDSEEIELDSNDLSYSSSEALEENEVNDNVVADLDESEFVEDDINDLDNIHSHKYLDKSNKIKTYLGDNFDESNDYMATSDEEVEDEQYKNNPQKFEYVPKINVGKKSFVKIGAGEIPKKTKFENGINNLANKNNIYKPKHQQDNGEFKHDFLPKLDWKNLKGKEMHHHRLDDLVKENTGEIQDDNDLNRPIYYNAENTALANDKEIAHDEPETKLDKNIDDETQFTNFLYNKLTPSVIDRKFMTFNDKSRKRSIEIASTKLETNLQKLQADLLSDQLTSSHSILINQSIENIKIRNRLCGHPNKIPISNPDNCPELTCRNLNTSQYVWLECVFGQKARYRIITDSDSDTSDSSGTHEDITEADGSTLSAAERMTRYQCVCDLGYLKHGGDCIRPNECMIHFGNVQMGFKDFERQL